VQQAGSSSAGHHEKQIVGADHPEPLRVEQIARHADESAASELPAQRTQP
jgi:hypothetical protein